jgi:hypothetical protein
VVYCKKLIIGGHTHEAHQDSRYQESLQVRKERRLRRMPDFLPVRMQDQLRYRKPEVRKQGKVIAKQNAASLRAAFFFDFYIVLETKP